MRILYLHPKSWTGERSILPVLRDMGHEIAVLEEKRGMQGPCWQESSWFETPGDGIRTCWHDPGRGLEKLVTWGPDRIFRRGFEGRNLVHRMWMIRRAARRLSPDVLLACDGFTYALPASFLRQLGLLRQPVVSSYIGGDILDCPQAEVGRSRNGMTGWLLARSYRGLDRLRPVSPMLREILLADGVDPSRLSVCPSHLVAGPEITGNVLDRRLVLRRQLRQALGIPQDSPLVVTLSANIKGKGLQVLGQAWPAVLAACPRARWLLCGPQSPWLRDKVLPPLFEAGLGESLTMTGALSGTAVFEHLACADLHLNPSLCEGLNMVSVEAAAVGTPTITTSATGIADWVTRFACGDVVPASDSAALADAIIKAFSNTGLLPAWSAAAVEMSREFAPDRVARQLLEILKAAVNSNTSSP